MLQVRGLLADIRSNKSLMDTIYVTSGMFVNSVFSYFLQLFIARNLSVADFGTYNALLALFAMLNIPAVVFSITAVKAVSRLYGLDQEAKLSQLFWRLSLFTFLAGTFVVLALTIFKGHLADYMNVDNSWLYFFLGLYIMGGFMSVAPSAFLQGMQRFKTYALIITNMGVIRLLIPAGLIILGYKVGGAYFGLFLAMSLNYLISTFFLSKELVKPARFDLKEEYKKIFGFSLPVLIMYIGTMSLNNVDVILVKKYFEADQAGYYAGTVILGKIILFGAGSFSFVMFPQITALKEKGGDYIKKMKFFLLVLLPVLLIGIICYNVFPVFIAQVFFGQQLLNSAKYLPLFSVFISIYVLVSFLFMFFMAIDRNKVIGWVLPAVLAQFILINLYHDSLFTILRINIIVTVSLLAILIFYLYKISNDSAQ